MLDPAILERERAMEDGIAGSGWSKEMKSTARVWIWERQR